MTPEQLETLILTAADGEEIQAPLATLTEAQRKALSSTAQSLYRQLFRMAANADASPRLKKCIEDYKARRVERHSNPVKLPPVHSNVTLALFALGPLSALKKQGVSVDFYRREVLEQIISDRKPDWLGDWLAFDLETRWPHIRFVTLRRWIREGLCEKPVIEGYYRMFASELMRPNYAKDKPPRPPLSRQLLADPDMLDDVWRLFEIETLAFNTNSWFTKNAAPDYETWPQAFVRLAKEGHLDRSRLLDVTLQGLHRDLKQNQLSGYHKLHELLGPSKEERVARQPEYISLLSHKVAHVVKFALGMVAQIDGDGALNRELFLAEVPSVFLLENKSHAIAALKLVKRIAMDKSRSGDSGLDVVIEALRHAEPDVQQAALVLLEQHKERLDERRIDHLRGVSDFVAASLRSKLLALSEAKEEDNDPQLKKTEVRPAAVPRQDAHPGSVSASHTNAKYVTISTNILNHSILSTVQPISPIENIDDLIAAVSHAVEVVDSPDEVERILDGISRLCGDKPGDFGERTAPLLLRLRQWGGNDGICGMGGVRQAMKDLLLTWLTGRLYRTPDEKWFSPLDAIEPAVMRLRALTERVVHGRAQLLMAAPTHSGGWIDPVMWVNRFYQVQTQKLVPDRVDFCTSLLRLSPDRREEAREKITLLSTGNKRIAGFVLGGDEMPDYVDRKDYDVWISAARARDPYADWSAVFEPLQLDDAWPDSLRQARLSWKAYLKKESREYNFGGKKSVQEWTTPKLDVEASIETSPRQGNHSSGVLSAIGRALSPRLVTDRKMLPSAALNHWTPAKYVWSTDLVINWVAQWLPYQWPLHPDGAYIIAAADLAWRVDMEGSSSQPVSGSFQGLFQKNRPWHEAAHLLVCTGLTAKNADARGLATDAMIWGIENGAVDIRLLAETLVRISAGGWMKLNRLGDNLFQVSQVSALHASVVGEVIQLWLPKVDPKQQNFFRMLEVLRETQSVTGQPIQPEALEALSRLEGGGKAAKIATELLRRFRQASRG